MQFPTPSGGPHRSILNWRRSVSGWRGISEPAGCSPARWPIGHQAAASGKGAFEGFRRQFLPGRKRDDELAVGGQQAERMRRIGVLLNTAADDMVFQTRVGAFLQGLALLGWTISRNVRIEVRWSGGKADEARRRNWPARARRRCNRMMGWMALSLLKTP